MLICPLCNKELHMLTKHLKKSHNISKSQFLSEYPDYPLVDEDAHRSRSEGAKTIWSENDTNIRESRKHIWEIPSNKASHSAAMRRPEVRERISEMQKKNWKENYEYRRQVAIDSRTSEISENNRKKAYERWSGEWGDQQRKLRKEPKFRIATREGVLKSYQTTDRSKKVSESNRRRWKNRDLTPDDKFVHGGLNVGLYRYNGTLMRSSWEVRLAKKLDELQVYWTYEELRYTYRYNGLVHTYIPDFYLPDYDLVLEVKPDERINRLTDTKLSSINNHTAYYINTYGITNIEKLLEGSETIEMINHWNDQVE